MDNLACLSFDSLIRQKNKEHRSAIRDLKAIRDDIQSLSTMSYATPYHKYVRALCDLRSEIEKEIEQRTQERLLGEHALRILFVDGQRDNIYLLTTEAKYPNPIFVWRDEGDYLYIYDIERLIKGNFIYKDNTNG